MPPSTPITTWTLKRAAWAYGCAKAGGEEERQILPILLRLVEEHLKESRAMTGSHPILVRVPEEVYQQVHAISQRTRIRLSDLYREAMADLVRKYAPPPAPGEGTDAA